MSDPLELLEHLVSLLRERRGLLAERDAATSQIPSMWAYGEENEYAPPTEAETKRTASLDRKTREVESMLTSIANRLHTVEAEIDEAAAILETWSVSHVVKQAVVNDLYLSGFTVTRKGDENV